MFLLLMVTPIWANGPSEEESLYTIPGYPCYRTISEINQQLIEWENKYPDLANLITIGYSYEGRPLQVIRLTNRLTFNDVLFPEGKPVFFLMANIHGNEIITNEVAMVFIQYLLEHYGQDPDVTWLLDERDIYVMVSANPDGHIKNEGGEPWSHWRKNTNPDYGYCDGDHYGVDLNRNFGFKWGGEGSDSDPCGKYYQGPYAVSEYETQAIQTFMSGLFADQRGPGDFDVAPSEATGIFVSLHSYGNLILWPWGYTDVTAPNEAHLKRLGQKFAVFTGYQPQQAYYLYHTNGTTADWAYGELGIASCTFEIGSYDDGGYYPPCSRYDALVQPNVRALLYAAKVARTPYLTSFGPDALYITSTPVWTLEDRYIEINATVTAEDLGSSKANLLLDAETIAGAEAYIDVPPWRGGVPYPLEAVDGAFDDLSESVHGQLPLSIGSTFTSGKHLVFVRGRNGAGDWGPVAADFITVSVAPLMPPVATQSGFPGARVPYTLTLTNVGQVTHTFSLTHSASHWSTTVVPTRVRELSPASYVTVVVTVVVPAEGASSVLFPSDVVTLTAIVEDDSAVESASAVLTTKLRVEHRGFLPLIMRISGAGRVFSGADAPILFWGKDD